MMRRALIAAPFAALFFVGLYVAFHPGAADVRAYLAKTRAERMPRCPIDLSKFRVCPGARDVNVALLFGQSEEVELGIGIEEKGCWGGWVRFPPPHYYQLYPTADLWVWPEGETCPVLFGPGRDFNGHGRYKFRLMAEEPVSMRIMRSREPVHFARRR